MEQAKLVGVGYRGRSDRVARLLNKVVEDAKPAYDIQGWGPFDNSPLLKKRTITGFYLGFIRQALNLSLYTKTSGRHSGATNRRISCPLVHKTDGLQ